MKKIYLLSLVVIASAMYLLTACTKTEIDDVVMVPDGSSARVALNFNVKSSVDITTRAAQPEYYEYLVNNIYVLIFNGNQRIELSENANDKNGNVNFFSPEEIKDYQNRLDDAGSAESSGTIEFGAISGAGLKICAVANLGVSNSMTRADFDEDAITKDLNKFDAIKTYDEFKKMSISLRANTVMRGASFVMTGEMNDVTLQASTNENVKTEVTIPLERTDSKITFNVKAANDELQDFEFIPLKWRVVNVPTVSYVLPRIEDTAASTTLTENLDATVDNVEADFFSIPAEEAILFEGKVQEGETSVDNSGTFTFYMYENLKAPKETIKGSDATAYALREKQVKNDTSSGVTGQRYENGDYVYAPKGATYVVFTGQVSYTETDEETKQDRFVLADVEYSVHLGHDSNTNVNSYNTLRNHHYTYNVTVTGINDLLVEVESNNPSEGEPTDDERRPGAEGDIVMSASQIVEVDGHYDRALITLTAEEANKIFFAVSTPWERGLDTNGFLEANNTTMRDYKWVKFLIHDSSLGIADGNFAAYPGDQCYDGGKTAEGTAAPSGAYSNKSVTLRDVRQLSTYFKNHPTNETVTITMFIDEYLYYYDPTSDPITTPENTTYKGVKDLTANDAGLLLWKKSVNNEPRLMHIVKAGDMTYSADGETSISRSVVTIKQQPILSIYNASASDDFLKTAWGIETVNETPRLTTSRAYTSESSTNYVDSYSNARTQLAGTKATLDWSSVISSKAANRYELLGDYSDPSYACAMRNRDLDGDGLIDPDEVLWYLPAISQINDLWIADPIMPNDAKLYDPNNPDGYYQTSTPASHYASSTIGYSNNHYNYTPRIYWAEEYGATSTMADEVGWGKSVKHNGSTVYSVRCLRNIGIPYGSTTMPQDYIEVEQPKDGIVSREDITDEVLADGVANSNEYDERTSTEVNETSYKGPDVNDNTQWNNDTTENDYGYVEREYQWYWGGGYYTYTYYNYIYYKVTDNSIDGSITLPYINKGALRSSPDNGTSLSYVHLDDIGENNRPFTGFFVQYNSKSIGSQVEAWYNAYKSEISTIQSEKICPTGYRVPNQREMVLMSKVIEHWEKTNSNNVAYVMLNGQLLGNNFGAFYFYTYESRISRNLVSLGTTGFPEGLTNSRPTSQVGNNYVRCVKDNPNAKHSSSSDFNEGGEG